MHSGNLQIQERCQELSTSKYNYCKENIRHEAEDRASTNNSPGLQENRTNDLEHERICELMILPSIDMDEDIFCYLVRHHNTELSRISDKFNVFEPYEVGQGQKLAIEVKPQYDTESIKEEFQQLYHQVIVDYLKIPEEVEVVSLKSLVETMAEFKDVELRFVSKERVCKIVGSFWKILRAKDDLLDVIKSNLPASQKGETSTDNVEITPAPLCTIPAVINTNQARTSVFSILSQSHDSLMLSFSNSLTIEVKYGDLTKMQGMDVVVSYIDRKLDIDDPQSDEIMRAAGPNVKKELLSHKRRLSSLPVGCLVHTSAGNLRGVKAIIHVVHPQVHERPHRDQSWKDALRIVLDNCLRYTNEKLKLKSICLPPLDFSK